MASDIPPSTLWTALLMAGGESRRMGCDKATLTLGGEPLWRRQIRTLREAGAREIMIARGALEPLGTGEPGLIHVPDARPGCGPLGGLAAAFQRASTRRLLVLAVDLPLMPAWFLREMMAMTGDDERGRGVVPVLDGHWEPLAAVYMTAPGECFAAGALRDGNRSLQHLVQELKNYEFMREFAVLEENRAFFQNVNTPEDLAEIERQFTGGG